MSKRGYHFNPDTLSFDKERSSLGVKILRLCLKLLSGFFLGGGFVFLLWIFIDSPKEMALQRENENILTQFRIMNNKVDMLENILENLEQRDDNIYRLIFESEPIDKSIRRAGSGGVNRYEELKHLNSSKIVIGTAKKIDELSKAIYIQSKSYDEIELLAKNKIDMLASIPAILPVSFNPKFARRITSGFGQRIDPIYKVTKFHAGIDFNGAIGTPIYATGNGVINKTSTDNGYGRHVVIDHGYNYRTIYAHLDKFNVKAGDIVKRGDIIGFLGNTGKSVGPHIHYEVRKNNVPVNPINYFYSDLTADDYDALVEAANNTGQSMD